MTATGKRLRLADLDELEPDEFDLLLEILSDATAAHLLPADAADVLSSDGSLKITLEPTGDGRTAVIRTPDGIFSGPDHWITIERNSVPEIFA